MYVAVSISVAVRVVGKSARLCLTQSDAKWREKFYHNKICNKTYIDRYERQWVTIILACCCLHKRVARAYRVFTIVVNEIYKLENVK